MGTEGKNQRGAPRVQKKAHMDICSGMAVLKNKFHHEKASAFGPQMPRPRDLSPP